MEIYHGFRQLPPQEEKEGVFFAVGTGEGQERREETGGGVTLDQLARVGTNGTSSRKIGEERAPSQRSAVSGDGRKTNYRVLGSVGSCI